MGSFILFILWTVGLIVYSVELWGPSGVNSSCQLYVNAEQSHGQSTNTLAYLEQHSICKLSCFLWLGLDGRGGGKEREGMKGREKERDG